MFEVEKVGLEDKGAYCSPDSIICLSAETSDFRSRPVIDETTTSLTIA